MTESPLVVAMVAVLFLLMIGVVGWDAFEQHNGLVYITPPWLIGAFSLTISSIIYWRFKKKE